MYLGYIVIKMLNTLKENLSTEILKNSLSQGPAQNSNSFVNFSRLSHDTKLYAIKTWLHSFELLAEGFLWRSLNNPG